MPNLRSAMTCPDAARNAIGTSERPILFLTLTQGVEGPSG